MLYQTRVHFHVYWFPLITCLVSKMISPQAPPFWGTINSKTLQMASRIPWLNHHFLIRSFGKTFLIWREILSWTWCYLIGEEVFFCAFYEILLLCLTKSKVTGLLTNKFRLPQLGWCACFFRPLSKERIEAILPAMFNANFEDAKRETSLGLSKKGPGFSKVKVTNRIKLAKGVRSWGHSLPLGRKLHRVGLSRSRNALAALGTWLTKDRPTKEDSKDEQSEVVLSMDFLSLEKQDGGAVEWLSLAEALLDEWIEWVGLPVLQSDLNQWQRQALA